MKNFLRDILKPLKPYEPGNKDCALKMDANESPFKIPWEVREQLALKLINDNDYHLYPDSDANVLRDKLAKLLEMSKENILIGNGSNELIQIVTTAFAGPGDTVLYPTPSFGMYEFYAKVSGAKCVKYSLDGDFYYDVDAIKNAIVNYKPALVFICLPNNPTGSVLPMSDILDIAKGFEGIVAVDEAYQEFYGESAIKHVKTHPNLVVLRTFSKAMGIAGFRVGYSVCNENLANEIRKLKPPYNVNSFSQYAAESILEHIYIQKKRVKEVINARDWLYKQLGNLKYVKTYPTQGNFILIKVSDSELIYEKLLERGILVRHYHGDSLLKNHLRVTVGSMEDCRKFFKNLSEVLEDMGEVQ